MARVIYYTYADNSFHAEPELVLKHLNGYAKSTLLHCPAFVNNLKNTYIIRASIDYDLTLENKKITSSTRDQDFFDQSVVVRDVEEGVCSFKLPRIILFTEKPVELEVKAANYHPNGFTENSTIIEGRYDIGKHFRALEIAFMFKPTKKVTMSAGDVLYYVKLHTTEKIKLVPFHYTENIKSLVESKFLQRQGKPKPLSYWYDIHDKFYKKRIIKLIKESLL